MKIIEKIMEILSAILPFLRRKDARQLKEFSELITSQYGFLVEQLEKALRDYFELSDRVKDLHSEIVALRGQLANVLPEQCLDHGCKKRQSGIFHKKVKALQIEQGTKRTLPNKPLPKETLHEKN